MKAARAATLASVIYGAVRGALEYHQDAIGKRMASPVAINAENLAALCAASIRKYTRATAAERRWLAGFARALADELEHGRR